MAVFVWGFGKLGQLGNGTLASSRTPVLLKVGEDKSDKPVHVCTGGLFTAVITQKGNVYVCGCGKYGRLGTGNDKDAAVPTKITLAKDAKVSQISAGSWHTCAITYLGRLFSWGYNAKHNVLGRDCDLRCSPMPGVVPSLAGVNVKKVSCGHNFTLICTTDGKLYAWGCGRYGVLGMGNEECVLTPTLVEALERVFVETVCAGYTHCGAVTKDGRLYMWGKGGDGALGLGTEDLNNKNSPVWQQQLLGVRVTDVSCSVVEHRGHTLALSDEGCVYAWGSNYKGKLGLGDFDDRGAPVRIPQQFFQHKTIAGVSAGGIHSGAVADDGTVFTWGAGKDGRLGHLQQHDLPSMQLFHRCEKPKVVEGLPANMKAVQISCSHYHTAILMVPQSL